MSIFVRNPETERKVRELAALEGATLTSAIEVAVDEALTRRRPTPRPKRTLEEMIAATERFRKAAGLDKPHEPITKADFDALYDYLPGMSETGD